ncbi:MAG: crossover junction endodeoxyribonuclease RuvC [Patescibacteria group bacterium]
MNFTNFKTLQTPGVFLGIDPGYGRTGFGIISVDGPKIKCLDYGVIETPADCDFSARLLFLSCDIKKLIRKYKPTVVAIEELFFFKNVTTAIKVAQARGALILAAAESGCEIMEFTPLQVKQAIACYGRADKMQVQKMVKTLLNLQEIPKPDDSADALAIAICASGSYRLMLLAKKH